LLDHSKGSDAQGRAGAHWRTHAKEGDVRQQAWDLETYEAWMGVVEGERRREAQGAMSEQERSGIDVSVLLVFCSAVSVRQGRRHHVVWRADACLDSAEYNHLVLAAASRAGTVG